MRTVILLSLSCTLTLYFTQSQPIDLDSPITIKKAFDSVDGNKDGAITFEEFKNQIRNEAGRNPTLNAGQGSNV